MASSAAGSTREVVDTPPTEEQLAPVPEAPWVRKDEDPPGGERSRPRTEAVGAAPLSGGRRRRRAWDRTAGTLAAPRPVRVGPDLVITRGVATAGAIGIATAVAAVMGAAGAAGWLIGLVASVLTFALVTLVRRA